MTKEETIIKKTQILKLSQSLDKVFSDNSRLLEENKLLRVALTQVNNVVQPLWKDLQVVQKEK